MDIVTQGLLGATAATAAASRPELRTAALCGFAAGLLADADALIRSDSNPLLTLEYHRHFSHSLLFAPIGALVAAALLWPFVRQRLSFPRLCLYTLLGHGLSGLLDACTSYGTMLLWPFSDARIAWSIVSIVDPIFSALLLVALAFAIRWRRAPAARIGLSLALGYLLLGAAQHQRAGDALRALAHERGHVPERLLVKPTFGNLLLWRGLYLEHGQVHADALRVGTGMTFYPGRSAPLAPEAGARGDGPAARFAYFADGWVVADPRHPGRLGDARYAMLPTSVLPLWGIEIDGDGSVRFVTDRRLSKSDRKHFLDMLRGRPVPR